MLQHFARLFYERVKVEHALGQINHIHALAVLAARKRRRRGKPTRVSAHNLDYGHYGIVVYKTVAYNLLGGCRNVLCRRAVTGSVVGNGKVVIYRLGAPHKAYGTADFFAVLGKLVYGVHRIVAADIEKGVNIQFFKRFEDMFVSLFVALYCRQFIAAGAEEGRRRALQKVHIQVVFDVRGKVHNVPVQKPFNAVHHSVNNVCAPVLSRFKHTQKTCVDYRSGTARLPYDYIFHLFPLKIIPCGKTAILNSIIIYPRKKSNI